MDNDRYASWGAATGILATILLVGAFGGFILPNAPDLDAPATSWGAFYADHQSRIQVGVTLAGVGVFFFAWFLGSLRSALARAEGGRARLASVAFGGGLLGVASLLVGAAAIAVAAFRPTDVDPTITRAFSDFSFVVGGPGAGGLTALFAATAIVGYRNKAVPPWVAGFSALAAITQPLGYGVAVTDSGAFAGDGVVGGFIPIITFVLAIVTLSIALIRKPQGYAEGASAPAPQSPAPQ